MPVSDDCHGDTINYRQKYRNLKKKFRYLIYENECFQDELRKSQRKLLKVNQDKSFLLDRLLQYERIVESSSDSDVTLSSDSEADNFALKRKKPSSTASNSHHFAGIGSSNSTMTRTHSTTAEPAPKRKKPSAKSPKSGSGVSTSGGGAGIAGPSTVTTSTVGVVPAVIIKTEPEELVISSQGDGHMTSEEIERHLESRQILMDLVPERAPPTVPTEMFSNDVLERFMMADDDD